MNHSFNVEVAEQFGLEEAIILENIYFWVKKNEANDTNCKCGKYWTYNSAKAFSELFPYMNESKIYRVLKNLEEKGLIETGCFNQNSYERTKWYTITNFAKSFYEICKNDFSDLEIPFCKNEKWNSQNLKMNITDINTDNKPNENKDINNEKQKKSTHFVKPTVEEIKAYCEERNNNLNAEQFFDYYESKGWKVGKSPMKDWKASVRLWERNNFSGSEKKYHSQYENYCNRTENKPSEIDYGETIIGPDGQPIF